MKFLHWMMVVAAAVLTSPAALAGDGASLVRNGSMNDESTTDWMIPGGSKDKIKLSRDTETFVSAPASLCIELTGGSGIVQQKISNTSATKLKLTGKVKVGDGVKAAKIAFQFFDGKWKQLAFSQVAFVTPGGWSDLSKECAVPAGATHILMLVVLDGQGKVWLDDLAVVDAAAPADSTSSSPSTAAPATAISGKLLAANDPAIRYVGRFAKGADHRMFSWPASEISIRFTGAGDVGAKLKSDGNTRFEVVVDGKDAGMIDVKKDEQFYTLAKGLSADTHTINLVKRTETLFGEVQFLGFLLPESAKLETIPNRPHRLEVIGDSISAGFGNETNDPKAPFSFKTQNAFMSYGAITARMFNADFMDTAWSGKTMWAPKNMISEIYDRTLPRYGGSKWDFSGDKPDAIVINLGTNDFAGGNPEEEPWINGYRQFIAHLRQVHSDTLIVCAVGPMLTDPWSPSKNALTTCRRYVQRVVKECNDAGDKQVVFLEFTQQKEENGFGAQYHPTIKTHQLMAGQLAELLENRLGWKKVPQ